jgi:hypothetical protein
MRPVAESRPVRIGIANAESGNHLVMMIANGSQCEFHHLTLAQARAVSLDIIKNVYLAEMRNNMNVSQQVSRFSFQMKQQIQNK